MNHTQTSQTHIWAASKAWGRRASTYLQITYFNILTQAATAKAATPTHIIVTAHCRTASFILISVIRLGGSFSSTPRQLLPPLQVQSGIRVPGKSLICEAAVPAHSPIQIQCRGFRRHHLAEKPAVSDCHFSDVLHCCWKWRNTASVIDRPLTVVSVASFYYGLRGSFLPERSPEKVWITYLKIL